MKLLDEIHAAFTLFLDASGEIWAPILSQWTLHLLGQLSQDYSARPAFAHIQSVNEIIHIWMGSKAIQSLLELTSRCLTCSDHANADAFISALLGEWLVIVIMWNLRGDVRKTVGFDIGCGFMLLDRYECNSQPSFRLGCRSCRKFLSTNGCESSAEFRTSELFE
jgi:hypothetical protein